MEEVLQEEHWGAQPVQVLVDRKKPAPQLVQVLVAVKQVTQLFVQAEHKFESTM